jgi:predicted porin
MPKVTRLGYVGLSHDKYGRAVIGTQYTPFSDVIGVADDPIWFATDSAYDNQGNLGTMRGDKMISYRNGVKFSDDFMLNFGLGWQGQHEYDNKAYSSLYPFNSDLAYHYRTQGAISATFMGVTLGIARTQGDVEIWEDDIINRPVTLKVVVTENAQSNALSVKYGQYGKGFYGAIVYEKNEYMNNPIDESGSGFPTPDDNGFILDKSTIAEAIIAYETFPVLSIFNR